MSSSTPATWVKFFSSAGIPHPTNATYAHIFVENRIQLDMLSELNKEYLREMGISPMGDIISILRHAKTVNDQSVRDKILSSNIDVPRTIVKVRPASPVSSSINIASIAVAPPRRVLPEHEGKYKISLPKGNTKKSREILAKHSALQMDKYEKKSVFDRLKTHDVEMADSTSNELTRMGKVSSSIFARLGDYKEIDKNSIAFSGILKNSPIQQAPRGIVKYKPHTKIVLKKPQRRNVMITDESDCDSEEKMDSDEYKQVSFSPEVEVLEIEPRRQLNISPNKMNRLKGLRTDGIRNRLGDFKIKRTFDPSEPLHSIKKTISMKPKNISPGRNNRMIMRADQSPVSVKERLNVKSRSGTNQITNSLRNMKFNKNGGNIANVFDRLGKK